MSKSKNNILSDIDKLEVRIGDREIASEIIHIYYDNDINKSVLLNRYKNIVTLFNSLGFKPTEIYNYIKKNKKVLKLDTDAFYENYRIISGLFIKNNSTKTELREYIKSSFNGKSILLTQKGEMIKTYNLFDKIFKANGKSKEDLEKYLFVNRNVLMENSISLLSKLAILSEVGLDNKLIFEEPMYIYNDLDLSFIHNAIECLKEKGEELTLNKIYSYAYGIIDNEEEIKYDLTEDNLSKSSINYCSKLTKNIR